jgi:hypothetical protein
MRPSRLWLALLPLVGACATPPSRPADHVVVVSIDGLVPEYAADAEAQGVSMPTLAALRSAGAVAEGVVGVYPTLTYPSHTTIVTGVRPARHGIVSNTAFDPEAGSERWLFDAEAIRSPTLWQAAHDAGLTTGGVSWPVTVGAEMDALYPETSQFHRNTTWLELARRQSTPGLVDAVVEELGGFEPDGNRDPLGRDRFATAAARVILREHAPALLLVHLVQTDYAQHAHGRGSPEARQAFENVDAHLQQIVAAVEASGLRERTAFVVTGDHGFRNVEHVIQPNLALREAGFLETDAEGRITTWRAMAHRAAIRLADAGDADTAAGVSALFEKLASEHAGVFSVISREHLDRLAAKNRGLEPTYLFRPAGRGWPDSALLNQPFAQERGPKSGRDRLRRLIPMHCSPARTQCWSACGFRLLAVQIHRFSTGSGRPPAALRQSPDRRSRGLSLGA